MARVITALVMIPLILWTGIVAYHKVMPHVVRQFEVKEISLAGANQVTRREMLERLAIQPGQPVWSFNTRRLEIRLESHPWIKRAAVSRVLPHTLAVHITERRPAAVLRNSSMTLLLDEEGHALSVLSPAEDPGLPVMTGINPKGLLAKEGRLLLAAQRGIELAGLLTRTFQGRPRIDMTNPDDVVAYLDGLRLQFGPSPFEEKWERYRTIEPYLAVSAGPGHGEVRNEIDLRYPGKVIVRERG
jgi:cell division protein FtsQ